MAKHTTTVFIVALCVAGGLSMEYTNLYVKYPDYFHIPKTLPTIKEAGFVKMAHDPELKVDLYSLLNDPKVSVGFDPYGTIACLRISYVKEDLPRTASSRGIPFIYKFFEDDMMTATYWGKEVYHMTLLFTSPETLKSGGRKDSRGLVADDLYVLWGRKSIRLPRTLEEDSGRDFSIMSSVACIPGMGYHYPYQLAKLLSTQDCMLYPKITLLETKGYTIGLVFSVFGDFNIIDRKWMEPGYKKSGTTIPCEASFFDKYHEMNLHVYLNDNPKGVTCP